MANTDAPFGFRARRHLRGGCVRSTDRYTIATDYATKLYLGDPVTLVGTGQRIQRATAGSGGMVLGVFAGCFYADAQGEPGFHQTWDGAGTGRTEIRAMVFDDPYIEFEAQVDGVIAEADAYLNFDVIFTHAGNDLTGRSGAELDVTSKATTDALQFRVTGLADLQDNDYGANAIVVGQWNLHALRDLTGT